METLHVLFDNLIKDVVTNEKYKEISNFIKSDSESALFINDYIFDGEQVISDSSIIKVAEVRARHSVITYLFGLLFLKFKGFNNIIYSKFLNNYKCDYNVVSFLCKNLLVSHDYGYFCKDIESTKQLNEFSIKHNLFDDKSLSNDYKDIINNNVLLNNYDQITNYYRYSIHFHDVNKDNEKCDHGILGAYLLYDKLSSKNNSEFSIYLNKIICLTIAQHNIFKSTSINQDDTYKKYQLDHLLHDRDYYIQIKYPLLALLSLVDTIECVKRFSRSSNPGGYLETLTVLDKIELDVSTEKIIIDYEKLYDAINGKKNNQELIETFEKYINSICRINTWTKYIIEKVPNYKYRYSIMLSE